MSPRPRAEAPARTWVDIVLPCTADLELRTAEPLIFISPPATEAASDCTREGRLDRSVVRYEWRVPQR